MNMQIFSVANLYREIRTLSQIAPRTREGEGAIKGEGGIEKAYSQLPLKVLSLRPRVVGAYSCNLLVLPLIT